MAAAALPFIGMGLSALGGLFGNRSKTYKTTQDQNWNNTTMPVYDPTQTQLRDYLKDFYLNRLMKDPDLSGYKAQGMRDINRSAGTRSAALNNILAARGLSYSPAAATALGQAEMSRISDLTNFQNSIPLLSNQLQRENLGDLMGLFKSLPFGQNQTGASHMSGTTTDPGNRLGGLFGGAGSMLGFLMGNGMFGGRPKVGGGNIFDAYNQSPLDYGSFGG